MSSPTNFHPTPKYPNPQSLPNVATINVQYSHTIHTHSRTHRPTQSQEQHTNFNNIFENALHERCVVILQNSRREKCVGVIAVRPLVVGEMEAQVESNYSS